MRKRYAALVGGGVLALTGIAQAADMPVKAPVRAAPPQQLYFGGLLEIYGGWRQTGGTDDNLVRDDHAIYGGNAFLNIPLGTMASLQLDAQGEKYHDRSNGEHPIGVAALGAHLSARNPQQGLIGGFIAKNYVRLRDGGNERTESGWIAGGEFQVYVNNLTLYVQGGFGDIPVEGSAEGFIKGTFVRGVARYFLNENALVQGEVAYGRTSTYVDNDNGGEFWNWAVKLEGRIHPSAPVFGAIEYQGGRYYTPDQLGDTATDHAVLVSLKVLLGGGPVPSLKQNDRYGATLDLPMLPGRAAAWTEGLD
jgi:hypothetical protein